MVFSYLGDFSLDKDEKERLEMILESRDATFHIGRRSSSKMGKYRAVHEND